MSQSNLFEREPVESTLSPAASRVPISALPVAEPDSLASAAAFGSRCSESSPLSARVGASLRTFLLCAVAELTSFSLAWKRQATPLGRSWWVLGRSARHTGGSGSGLLLDLWPTPIAGTSGGNRGGGSNREGTYRPGLSSLVTTNWATPTRRDEKGPGPAHTKGGRDLATDVAVEWPTPTAESYGTSNNGCPGDGREAYATKGKPSLEGMARQDWPTPQAADSERASETMMRGNPTLRGATLGPPGQESLNSRGNRRGSLNPDWVETLMGAPPSWTDLPAETVSALWETRIRHTSRKLSGGGS